MIGAAATARRLSDRGNVNAERVFPDQCPWSDTVHQIVRGTDLISGSDQPFDDLKRPRADGYQDAGRQQLTPAEVDLPRADP